MGMFDSIYVPCPNCGTKNEFQSKSGDCLCECYTLDNCPQEVLYDINRHSPRRCECGCSYEIEFIPKIKIVNN